MSNNNVYIMIFNNNNKLYQVFNAYDYQIDAFNDYYNNKRKSKVKYKYKNDEIIFFLNEFNSSGLKQNYDDFLNFIREDGSQSVISNNYEKIKSYCAFANRLTSIPY